MANPAALSVNTPVNAPARAYEPVISLTYKTIPNAIIAIGNRAMNAADVNALAPGTLSIERYVLNIEMDAIGSIAVSGRIGICLPPPS
jgi:hypothetical protein